MRLQLRIEAILFRKGNGKIRYLILKRTPEKGGFWQPITGCLEEGESRIEALRREIREETGIENSIRIVERVHYYEFSDPHLVKQFVFGVEVSPNEKIVIGWEHCEFKWCSFQEALRLLTWKENKEALRKLNELLA